MHSLNLKLWWLKHLLASFLLPPMTSDGKPQLQSFIFRQIFEDRLKRAGGTIQPIPCEVLHFIDSELGLRKQTRLPQNRDEFPGPIAGSYHQPAWATAVTMPLSPPG